VIYVRKPDRGLDRQARKVISERLAGYFRSLTAELNKDAEAFFDSVMELAERQSSEGSSSEAHWH